MTVNTELRARREAIVREHAESENRHDFDFTLATFDHPRYELVPSGEVIDGPEAVAAYYRETREAFPDQGNEIVVLHHADDAVLMEFDLRGTHRGDFRGLPARCSRFKRLNSSVSSGWLSCSSSATRRMALAGMHA